MAGMSSSSTRESCRAGLVVTGLTGAEADAAGPPAAAAAAC